jgi:hypothetical protein
VAPESTSKNKFVADGFISVKVSQSTTLLFASESGLKLETLQLHDLLCQASQLSVSDGYDFDEERVFATGERSRMREGGRSESEGWGAV